MSTVLTSDDNIKTIYTDSDSYSDYIINMNMYKSHDNKSSVVSDETEHGFNSLYAFNYSDNLVIISHVTPVTI